MNWWRLLTAVASFFTVLYYGLGIVAFLRYPGLCGLDWVNAIAGSVVWAWVVVLSHRRAADAEGQP
jgi:hypothetical protein